MWGLDLSDGCRDPAVNFHIEGVELALALAQRVEQGAGSGGDSFCRCRSGFLCQVTGLDGASNETAVNRFRLLGCNCGAHEGLRRAEGAATEMLRTVAA